MKVLSKDLTIPTFQPGNLVTVWGRLAIIIYQKNANLPIGSLNDIYKVKFIDNLAEFEVNSYSIKPTTLTEFLTTLKNNLITSYKRLIEIKLSNEKKAIKRKSFNNQASSDIQPKVSFPVIKRIKDD